MWEGLEVEDGQHWQTDLNTVCSCTSGKVKCQTNIKSEGKSASSLYLSVLSLSVVFFLLSCLFSLHHFLCRSY